ncbi:hypothetical protein XENOCAPTIV_002925 [Xenoophorus captivus]|uniref:Small monomeric GTPase n=1 Tax=Xenoophorus captivus TaxID=1517983 RepID=A0ABV0R6I0_9TELE
MLLMHCFSSLIDILFVKTGRASHWCLFSLPKDNSQWLKEQCMRMGDAYIIVYSVTDKSSFEKASELRIQLRRARQSENIPIILVGNKSDLVRSREVSVEEGSACAVVFDCKFIETSASLHHNVHALFEGIVRQIRLRKDSKEENARRMANCRRRESISKKAKRFLGRMVSFKPSSVIQNIRSLTHRQSFTVEVCVIDKNDNVPTFIEESMRGSVQLGLLKGTRTLRSSMAIDYHPLGISLS